LRVGRIAYTNVAPVETAFDAGAVSRDAVITAAAPAALNALLAAGELDASPVSAAHYLANTDRLALLGDVCIAARGAVISVVLVSPTPPALLDGASIAVTRESASGRALVETLLRGRYGAHAAFEPVDDPAAEARSGRPTLLIGDAAIAIRDAVPAGDVYDLGQAWFDWTALPMVYAVWAVRRDVLAERPVEIARLAAAYAEARGWGEAHRETVIDAAQALRPRGHDFYDRYFSTLTYHLDDDARAGLARFAAEIAPAEVSRVAR
jgi:chorismate dehydratase